MIDDWFVFEGEVIVPSVCVVCCMCWKEVAADEFVDDEGDKVLNSWALSEPTSIDDDGSVCLFFSAVEKTVVDIRSG